MSNRPLDDYTETKKQVLSKQQAVVLLLLVLAAFILHFIIEDHQLGFTF